MVFLQKTSDDWEVTIEQFRISSEEDENVANFNFDSSSTILGIKEK